MKSKNFPQRKLLRKLKAEKKTIDENQGALLMARMKRTKKDRSKGRRNA